MLMSAFKAKGVLGASSESINQQPPSQRNVVDYDSDVDDEDDCGRNFNDAVDMACALDYRSVDNDDGRYNDGPVACADKESAAPSGVKDCVTAAEEACAVDDNGVPLLPTMTSQQWQPSIAQTLHLRRRPGATDGAAVLASALLRSGGGLTTFTV